MTLNKEALIQKLEKFGLPQLAAQVELVSIDYLHGLQESQWQRLCDDIFIGYFIYNYLHPLPQPISNGAKSLQSSLPSADPQGKPVELNDKDLLYFLNMQMKDAAVFHRVPHVIRPAARAIPLCGRQAALEQAAECMKVLSLPSVETDRVNCKIPVCAGLSGLGKTRMLEEWQQIMDLAGITCNRLGALVLYYNGHMPHPVERKMTIEASFSWRLLHRLFIEGNGDGFAAWFTKQLPVNGGDLTLRLASTVIRQQCIRLGLIKFDATLHLFIGVDEYQCIHEVGGKRMRNEELLQDLLDVLGDVISDPVDGVRIYPMFAGLDFSVISKPCVTRVQVVRLPMYLLTQADIEEAVCSCSDGQRLLQHNQVRRHLFYLGGVARWVTEYILMLLQKIEGIPADGFLSADTIERTFNFIKREFVDRWGGNLDPIDFVRLAAFALAGKPVQLNDKQIGGIKWSRLRDSSVCLINDGNQVTIPYTILRIVAQYSKVSFGNEYSDAIGCMIACLKGLIEKVDQLIYDKAPWQFWEVFGAYYHALRINSLIIVSGSQCRVSDLLKGALYNLQSDFEVELKPMSVMETADKFSKSMKQLLGRKGHENEQHDWLNEGLVLINGEGGAGVDLFYALKKFDSDGYVVITDQRKRSGGSDLGAARVNSLLENARIMPDIIALNSWVIPCLFSCITSANVGASDLPQQSAIVSYSQSRKYHGTLFTHPASSPFVNINKDPISFILMLLSGKDKRTVAEAIMLKRQVKLFTSSDDLESFVGDQQRYCKLIDDFKQRVTFC
ncbi:hypothetical protein MIR68_006254 [Amoeboaphelidium protococcarum]|nr:hypothetical protein MIR68_006254 [Amoeboaphelidium protococcarum]